MVETLMEIGPAEATGMGPVEIGWSALRYWQDQTGVELAPWQAPLLRRLSRDWIAESSRAAKKAARSPMSEMTIEQRRQMVSAKVDAFFGAMASSPPPKRAPRR